MNQSFSVYLDLVRFLAACLVYLYHSNQRWLIKDSLPLSNFGHSSVIVFFVLSGFVIAYVTSKKETEWISYAASRLSRVWSVAIPAIFLTIALDFFGRQLQPAIYDYPFDQFVLRTLASLLMLNEFWFVSITMFSNVPYWSITYEFWYYAAFGFVTFLPHRLALPAAVFLLLLLGPKLLLLAPIWYSGVLLYRWQALYSISKGVAWLLTLASAMAIVAVSSTEFLEEVSVVFKNMLGEIAFKNLTFSKFFVADYIFCLLVFCHFAGLRRLLEDVQIKFVWIEKSIRWVAGYTFTLYLLHQPLFLFWGSVLKGDHASIRPWLMVTVLTVLSVMALGHLTENKRHILRRSLVHRLKKLQLRLLKA